MLKIITYTISFSALILSIINFIIVIKNLNKNNNI